MQDTRSQPPCHGESAGFSRVAQTPTPVGGGVLSRRYRSAERTPQAGSIVIGDEVLTALFGSSSRSSFGPAAPPESCSTKHQSRTLHRLNQPGCGQWIGTGGAHQHNVLLKPFFRIMLVNSAIAFGWSPAGWKGLTKGGNNTVNLGCVTHVSILGKAADARRIGHPFSLATVRHNCWCNCRRSCQHNSPGEGAQVHKRWGKR